MGFSLSHLIVLVIILCVIGFPVAKILGRLGYSKAFVILAFIPAVNWIALWVLAFAQWPVLARVKTEETFR